MRTVKQLQFLIVFPNDVRSEAEVVDSVLDELNRSALDQVGVQLQAVRWDRDAVGGAGISAQRVIDEQLLETADGVVAIFWTRIGTQVDGAPSGSVSEVRRMLGRWKAGEQVEILIYFKSADISPRLVEPDQLSALNSFVEELKAENVLFKHFPDSSSFESMIRIDLTKIGTKVSNHVAPSLSSQETHSHPLPPEEEDELGLLDYMDIHASSLDAAGALMGEITAAIGRLTEANERRARELPPGDSVPNPGEVRRSINRTADDWNRFATDIAPRVQDWRQATRSGFDALSKSVPLFAPDDPGKPGLVESMQGFADTVARSIHTYSSFKTTVASFPRLTANLNQAKKRVVSVLDEIIDEFNATLAVSQQIVKALEIE